MSMELSDIEPALYDLKEQVEVESIRTNNVEERLDILQRDMGKVLEKLKAIDAIFDRAVRE